MQRRDFLKNTAAILSSGPLAMRTEAATDRSDLSSRMRIREIFITNDRLGVLTFAQNIAGGRYRFLDAYDAEFYIRFANSRDVFTGDSAWLLWAEGDGQPRLLESGISNSPIPGADKEGLVRWLTTFHPVNCNDWLMIPALYRRHVWDVESISWRDRPVFPKIEHVERVLSATRGLLLWQSQVESLVQQHCDVSRSEAVALWRRYMRRNDVSVVRQVNEAVYDGHLLGDVIAERTLNHALEPGWSEHLLAGVLSEHLAIR